MECEKGINAEITENHIPRWEELPSIELYKDQIIAYLDEALKVYVSKDEDGHILTKTMINNYVKNEVIHPTKKKKYNKEHIASLFIICLLKQIYSLNDIADLIKIATRTTSIENAYNNFCDELEKAIDNVFEGKSYEILKDTTNENYALRRVVLSFANKLYVDKVYLKRF